jgi:hypothetical protein
MDLGLEHHPLTEGVLIAVVEMIHYTDAKSASDHDAMMDAYLRHDEQRLDDENRKFIEERFPDFCADMRRAREIIADGRRRTKFLDVGSIVAAN